MKGRVYRDPVHGLIALDEDDSAANRLLDTRAMQRLRYIKQMGLAWLVYPGAEHSRFGHALGAFHLARKVASQLQLGRQESLVFKVAALLHDIGHGPFSHAWEEIFEHFDHERWGKTLLEQDEGLGDALESTASGLRQQVLDLYRGQGKPSYLKKLVSSELDVDRLDYLLRDGHYSGARYAAFDLDWIIHALRIDKVDGNDDVVVDYRRGMYAVEQYLFSRVYMYSQVYHHKTVRAAEKLFGAIIRRFRDLCLSDAQVNAPPTLSALAHGEDISTEQFLQLDDALVSTCVSDWAVSSSDDILKNLSARLRYRKLPKTVRITNAHPDEVEPVLQAIGEKHYGDSWRYYLHLDATTDRHASKTNQLFVIDHPVHETVAMSQLLDRNPAKRNVARIIVDDAHKGDVMEELAKRNWLAKSSA